MKRVRAGTRDGIHDAAGAPAVVGGRVARHHRELLHRVHAEHEAQHAARRAVRVVVDADAVQPIVVLLGAVAGDGQLRTQAADATLGIDPESRLGPDIRDSGLERRQRRPIAAVQGQFHDLARVQNTAQGRGGLFHGRGAGDAPGDGLGKAARRGRDLVHPGQEVRHRVEATGVGHHGPGHAGGHVGQGEADIGHQRAALVADRAADGPSGDLRVQGEGHSQPQDQ